MKRKTELRSVLLKIVERGLSRIRGFGGEGDAKACAVDAYHLHNVPFLLEKMTFDLLIFYFEVERPEFMRDAKYGVEEFEPLWDKLAEIIRDQGQPPCDESHHMR